MELFSAAIIRDSISLIKFTFPNHVHVVISSEISLVYR